MNAAIGFRVKSGWATAVLLAGMIEAHSSPELAYHHVVGP